MIGLGIFIFLFSRPVSEFNLGAFVLLIVFLSVFRLYDDLMQAENDLGKPVRDYTDPAVRQTLFYYLIVFFALLLGFVALFSIYRASLLFCFIIINHLLYLLFINNKTAAGLLPLLKYPFVFLLLQSADLSATISGAHLLFSALSLFLSFVAFESMEDKTFPVPVKYSYFLQAFSFILIFISNVNGKTTLSFFILLSLSVVWTFLRVKFYPYMYLLCFLVFRIITDGNYDV